MLMNYYFYFHDYFYYHNHFYYYYYCQYGYKSAYKYNYVDIKDWGLGCSSVDICARIGVG